MGYTNINMVGIIRSGSHCILVQQEAHCNPVTRAYHTHCWPPRNVLPKRIKKVMPVFNAVLLTSTSCKQVQYLLS